MSNNYTGRQIAIFADVHGLYYPLKSVLEDIKNRGIKEIYSLGDNIGVGPNPKEVLELLDKYKVVSLLGNNEEYSILGIEPFSIYFDEKKTENQLWTHNKLTKEDIVRISKNKHSLDLLVGGKKIGLCHFASDVRFDFVKHNIWGYFDAIKNKVKNPQKQFYYTNSVYQKRLVDKKSKRVSGRAWGRTASPSVDELSRCVTARARVHYLLYSLSESGHWHCPDMARPIWLRQGNSVCHRQLLAQVILN